MNKIKRYYSLDILKFVLSIIIVLHHFQQSTFIGTDKFRFYGGVVNFAYCVEFFFIISGFLSATKLLQTSETPFPVFLKHKIKRLYPMCIASVLCILILNWVYYFYTGIWLLGKTPDIFKVLNSFLITFATGIVDSGSGINNPLWYINILMLCYIILWIILHLCRKYSWNPIYLILIMCAFGCACLSYKLDLPLMNENTSRGYCAFFFGIVLFYLYENSNKKRLFMLSSVILIICTILLFVDYFSFYKYEHGSLVFVVFPSIMFIALYIDNFLRYPFLSYFGRISFAIYVWHSFCISIFRILMKHDPFNKIIAKTDDYVVMFFIILYILVFAIIIDRSFEIKFNDIANKVISWLFEKDNVS